MKRGNIPLTYRESETMKQPDRRVGRRYAVSTSCRFETLNRRYQGRLRNISLDGAFMETESETPADGETGTLFFGGPAAQMLRFRARVVHHSSRQGRNDEVEGFGIYFLDVDEEKGQRLQAFLKEIVATAEV